MVHSSVSNRGERGDDRGSGSGACPKGQSLELEDPDFEEPDDEAFESEPDFEDDESPPEFFDDVESDDEVLDVEVLSDFESVDVLSPDDVSLDFESVEDELSLVVAPFDFFDPRLSVL